MADLSIKDVQVLIYNIMFELKAPLTKEELAGILEQDDEIVSEAVDKIMVSKNKLIEVASNPDDGYTFTGTEADILKFEDSVDEAIEKTASKKKAKVEPEPEPEPEIKPEPVKKSEGSSSKENELLSMKMSRIARSFEKKRLLPEATVLSKSGLEEKDFYATVDKMIEFKAIETKEMADYDEKVYKKTSTTLSLIIDNDDLSKIKSSSISPEEEAKAKEESDKIISVVKEMVLNAVSGTSKVISGIAAAVMSENKDSLKQYGRKVTKSKVEEIITEMISDKTLTNKGPGGKNKYCLTSDLSKAKAEAKAKEKAESEIKAKEKQAESETPAPAKAKSEKPVKEVPTKSSTGSNEVSNELVKALQDQIETLKSELIDAKAELTKANNKISNVLKALS